jgi:hypothetical protein
MARTGFIQKKKFGQGLKLTSYPIQSQVQERVELYPCCFFVPYCTAQRQPALHFHILLAGE